MKALTANRLTDGKVVYRTSEGVWSVDPAKAEHLTEDTAEAALNAGLRDILTVVGPYLIEIETGAGFTPGGRKHVREAIRLSGPTTGSTKSMPGARHVPV
jgi:hypothetical protein